MLRLDSIRTKLLLFGLLATLVPSISTAWISYVHNKRSLEEKIGQQVVTMSDQAAREVELWFRSRLYDLRVFAGSYEVTENLERGAVAGSRPSGRLSEYFNSVRDRFQDYDELLAVDRAGRVMATSADQIRPVALPGGWEDQIGQNGVAFSPPTWDEARSRSVMLVALPVRQASGQLLGAIVARINLAAVDSTIERFAAGDTGQVFLLSSEGRIITSSRGRSPRILRASMPPDALSRLRAAAGEVHEYESYDGTAVVGTLRPLRQPGWAAVAEISATEAFRQAHRMRNVTILVVTLLLVGVGAMAYGLGLLIIRPVDRLTRGAASVAAGNLDVDIPVAGRGEVGYLTQVFNDMVTRLRDSRQELERLSTTDGLTGLANRRHLMTLLGTEAARARRSESAFAVILADVDHFKRYNDTHGHQAGDDALVRVAAVLREAIREVDCAARYGGEEFLVLLPDTDAEGAVRVAERVRESLGRLEFPGGKVTVSVGVSAYPEGGDSPEAVIASADEALYAAKRQGRDRIIRAGPKAPAAGDPPRGS